MIHIETIMVPMFQTMIHPTTAMATE